MEETIKNKILKNKLWLKICICVSIFLIMFLGVIYGASTFNSKGELNGDGEIDYQDVNLLELHLIHVQELPQSKISNADMNSDGEITVTDLTLLIQKIENRLEYEVTMEEISLSNYYPSKNEEITLSFSADVSYGETIKTINVNGEEYEAIQDELNQQNYEIKINVGNTAGIKNYKLENVTLTNGREIEINNTVKIDVLKDIPTVTDFTCTDLNADTIAANFKVNDPDNAITNGEIIVEDEEGNEIKRENFTASTTSISFSNAARVGYEIRIIANYDLDSNNLETGKNEFKSRILLAQEIGQGERLIEFKDISSIELYKQNGTNVEKLTNVEISELEDLSKFVVKVEMENNRSFYASIEEYKIVDNKLKFILDYDQIIQYEGEEARNKLEVEYGDIENDVAVRIDLQMLSEQIAENLAGTYKVTTDIDAKNFNGGTTVVPEQFTGTIDFGGHTIKNLKVPLFDTLNGATIENLILEDVTLSAATSRGTIANSATNTNIKNVHVKNLNLTTKTNATAGIVGTVVGGIIEECSVTKLNITTAGHIRVAGIVGFMGGGTIKNCYVEGNVNSTQSKDGNGIGSILGHATGGTAITIENCIAKVEYIWTGGGPRLNGGIIGVSDASNTILRNNISLATGTGIYKVHGSNIATTSTNNYELEESTLIENTSDEIVKTVSKNNITSEFYKNSANFDENIWNLSNASYDELPTLNNDDPNNNEEPSVYIPDYDRIKNLSNYKKDKEITYYNMFRLMPFYDARYYVQDGNKLPEDYELNTKIIKSILPYDENGKLILALSEEQKDKIKTIKILFTDNETISYGVSYKNTQEQIVHYRIDELGIDYTFDKYLVDTQSELYKYIVEQIKTFDYTNDLNSLVEENAVRTTSENYEMVKAEAENLAIKLLANNDEYILAKANSVVENKIRNELTTDKMLEKIAYVYNYYNRYYNIEIGGINMSDIVFFDTTIFSNNLNSINMTNTYMNTTAAYRGANNIVGYYNTYIMPSTGLGYMDFLEFFITNLAETKYKNDPASWILDNFNGTIYEQGAPRYPDIPYRVWDHLKAAPNKNIIPLLLSYQGDEMYLLGIPTTLLTGNMELYTKNEESRINFLKNFAAYAVPFYDTVAGVVEGTQGYTNMINRTQVSYDTTNVRNWSEDPNIPPALKAFNEPLGLWITSPASSAAFANGTDMRWVNSYALTSFVIYSHEAVHNQDGRIFLEGTGRRSGAGAEHFTDNFLTQGNNAYGVVPNYSLTRAITTQTTTNISKDRIDTKEKMESYYKGMYDTFAYLDYIEAMAFLQLTPLEQSRIAQVLEEGVYTWKTEEDFKNMHLETIEDIWENHLIIIRGNKAYTTGSMWYIYENKSVGAAPKAFFVLNAYQFLADFGYEGYLAYAGNKYGTKTDEEILKIMSGDETMTFKKYQLGRYEEVEKKLNQVEGINAEEAIKITLEAMKIDVANNKPIDINSYASIYRETLYGYLKRVTNDFETSIYDVAPNVVHIRSAEEFVSKIKNNPEVNIILDADIDFSNYSVETATIIDTFVGTFDGNGHKITGLTKPIFGTMVFANVKNLNIENSNVTATDTAGTLAKTMNFSILQDINMKNVTMTGTGIVGGLVGNINRTTVKDITFDGINASNPNNQLGGLFGVATNSSIENVHGVNSNIIGNNGYVGGIAGNVNTMFKISECSFNGVVTGRTNYVGGLIGNLQNSRMENCYTLGKVTGNSFVGGIVGNVSSSSIDKTYSNSTVTGNILAGTGGIVGCVANASNGIMTSSLTNSVSLGRVINGYKFDAYSAKAIIEDCFGNNYELEESMGNSTLNRSDIEFENRITPINLSSLNKEFYINNLNWDESIWDLKNVPSGGLPKLKGLDTNEVNTVIVKKEVATIEDFLKINEAPNEIYSLTQDIDFTDYTGNGNAVITTTFTGKLEGNNYTISNLTNSALFAQFNGIVQDLNISNFSNKKTGDYVAAFAAKSSNATFNNMKFENIELQGTNIIGTVVAQDNKDSTFDRISVKNMDITVLDRGMFAGGIVGAHYGGKISNVYVDGSIDITTLGAGGIVGVTGQNGTVVTISNAISNVNIVRSKDLDSSHRTNNAGIVGFLANLTNIVSVNNSISLGNMTGITETMVPHKFIATTEEIIQDRLTKCYECEEMAGISDITENTIGHLDSISRENLNAEFYTNLGFDNTIWNLDTINSKGYPELK